MDRSVMYIYFDLKNQSDVSTLVVFQREREREREREKSRNWAQICCVIVVLKQASLPILKQ